MHSWVGRAPSTQEFAVLRLVVLGLTNKGIAYELGVTEQTVKTHVTALLRKFGVTNRASLAVQAISCGVIPAPEVRGPGPGRRR